MKEKYNIACLGLWHLGEIYSACLADLGHQVTGISEDKGLIGNFSKNIPPLPEPDLENLLDKNQKAGYLKFSNDFTEIRNCNVLWFTFDTPVDDNDEVDLSPIYDSLEKAMPNLIDGVLVVMTSQVPVGEGKKFQAFIKEKKPNLKFDYVYTPENLRLGAAMKCFMEPGRIIVGAETENAKSKIAEVFSPLKTEVITMEIASAEMAKHAINSFLATSVSFINDIADACEVSGANILDVVRALRSEPRIGPKAFLDAGLGFSGGTLGRDLKALLKLTSLPVIENVYKKNLSRSDKAVSRLENELGGLNGKIITILGLTYKPGTRTLRRSRALEISKILKSKGAITKLHDPQALESEVRESDNSDFFRDLYGSVKGANAIVLITPWPEFKDINFKKLAQTTQPGAVIFDTANFIYNKEEEITKAGFKYIGIGR